MKTGVILVLLLTTAWLGAQNRVRVHNGRELAQAIGSGRLVVLAAGEYRVSEAARVSNPAVSWEPVFDGLQLVVTGVSHLTLRGGKAAALLAMPRYAYTLVFRDCHDLRLEDLTLGHTEAGECVGGVLRLEGCSEVRIEGCQLFGSGVIGLDLESCSGVTVLRSTIRDCTVGALNVSGVENLRLERVKFTGNQSWPLVWIDSAKRVVLDSCLIEDNAGAGLFWNGPLAEAVSLFGCWISHNQTEALLWSDSLRPVVSRTSIVNNAFQYEEDADGEGEEGDYTGQDNRE